MKKCAAQSGFTLVEMLVSLAIFMVVAVVAVGALLKITDANRKSQTLQDAINNINFSMDAITREVRVGSDYTGSTQAYSASDGGGLTTPGPTFFESCSSATPCDNASLAFLSSKTYPATDPTCNLTYAYGFAPHPKVQGAWTMVKAQQSSCGDDINPYTSATVLGSYAPILDPSVVITAYNIKVNAVQNTEPSVFLYISGYTGSDENTKTYFDIQTTISQRI